jgi:hypothetical protein
MVWVAVFMVRMSLPAIRGAAMIAHIAKWVRCSVSVRVPRPTSIMSGSVKAPGRAYPARGTLMLMMFWTPMG